MHFSRTKKKTASFIGSYGARKTINMELEDLGQVFRPSEILSSHSAKEEFYLLCRVDFRP